MLWASNRLLQYTDGDGSMTTFGYRKAAARVYTPLTEIDALGNRTTIVYDASDRVVGRIDATGARGTAWPKSSGEGPGPSAPWRPAGGRRTLFQQP